MLHCWPWCRSFLRLLMASSLHCRTTSAWGMEIMRTNNKNARKLTSCRIEPIQTDGAFCFVSKPWSGELHCCAGLHDTDSTTHSLQCCLCKKRLCIIKYCIFSCKCTCWLSLNRFAPFQDVGFTLIFSDIHLWASIFSVILVNYIFMDGKSDYFQGKYEFQRQPVSGFCFSRLL